MTDVIKVIDILIFLIDKIVIFYFNYYFIN